MIEEAFGLTTIKYDCGVKRTVPTSILLGLKQHVINEYLLYCAEICFNHLSAPTLRKILESIKPKSRKRVYAADVFLVNGYDAYEVKFEIK